MNKTNKYFFLVGSGSHARVVYSVLMENGYNPSNIFVVDGYKKRFERFHDQVMVKGGLDDKIEFSSLREMLRNEMEKELVLHVAYGGDPYQGNFEREKMLIKAEALLRKEDFKFSSNPIISKHALLLQPAIIGPYSLINPLSTLGIDSKIGKSCIINNHVNIEHDVEINDFAQLAPNSVVLGNSRIGKHTYIGAGAIIKNGIEIGNKVVVGMGAVVIRDVQDNSVVVGNPARVIKIFE